MIGTDLMVYHNVDDDVLFSAETAIISLNNINQLIFVMMKCGVLFDVRTEFLNIIYTSFGFKGLSEW
jgi:hypothetical protein